MSPNDSKARNQKITTEFELVERSNGYKFYAWHPLYNLNLSDEEKLRMLERHEEFKPIVQLYMEFGDSLNCVICPYKSIKKLLMHNAVEDLSAIYSFAKEALRSSKHISYFSKLLNKTMLEL
jgi:hypothetical protein